MKTHAPRKVQNGRGKLRAKRAIVKLSKRERFEASKRDAERWSAMTRKIARDRRGR